MVWSPKTKAKRNLLNDLLWRKSTFNKHIPIEFIENSREEHRSSYDTSTYLYNSEESGPDTIQYSSIRTIIFGHQWQSISSNHHCHEHIRNVCQKNWHIWKIWFFHSKFQRFLLWPLMMINSMCSACNIILSRTRFIMM